MTPTTTAVEGPGALLKVTGPVNVNGGEFRPTESTGLPDGSMVVS